MEEQIQSAPREQELSGSEAYAMARKRYQRGSVKLRGKVWYGRWREDVRQLDGTTIRVQKNEPIGTVKELPTKQLAKRELESRTEDVNSLTYRPRVAANFEQFSKRWQEAVMVNHKRSAQASEKSIIKLHLEPRWGTRSLKEIESDPEAAQTWAASLKVEPKTQRNIVKLMKRMLDTAVEWGYVKYNPLVRVRLKPLNLVEDEFALSLDQIRSIISAAAEPYKTMYWILGETGIRAGEVLALGYEHLDLGNRVIFIRRKVWRGEFETVKSRKGVRTFAISEQLSQHLAGKSQKTGLLFADGEGNPITYDHALKEVFQPLLKSLSIPICGFHAFRHGNATLLDQLGVPMQTRMNRLGHEKAATTLGYTHAVSEDDRVAADGIGRLLTEAIQ